MPRNNSFKSHDIFTRKYDTKVPKERFLIICEGRKTEPNYFKTFHVTSATVMVKGLGANTDSLIRSAIKLKNDAIENDEPYNQVWCVFDRDSFPAQNYNSAFELAKNNSISVAYSNQDFELWYLLHFNYYDSALSRNQYEEKLTELLKKKYRKNSETIYIELLDKQQTAIRNAQRLLDSYLPNPNPEKDNPSTSVHLLVQELNRFI
jgi:hypothetical protein